MMIFASSIEKKFTFILTFASATPFSRPRDPRLGNPAVICQTVNTREVANWVTGLLIVVNWAEMHLYLILTKMWCCRVTNERFGKYFLFIYLTRNVWFMEFLIYVYTCYIIFYCKPVGSDLCVCWGLKRTLVHISVIASYHDIIPQKFCTNCVVITPANCRWHNWHPIL